MSTVVSGVICIASAGRLHPSAMSIMIARSVTLCTSHMELEHLVLTTAVGINLLHEAVVKAIVESEFELNSVVSWCDLGMREKTRAERLWMLNAEQPPHVWVVMQQVLGVNVCWQRMCHDSFVMCKGSTVRSTRYDEVGRACKVPTTATVRTNWQLTRLVSGIKGECVVVMGSF